jgi:smad nuclear-interacting protein 1
MNFFEAATIVSGYVPTTVFTNICSHVVPEGTHLNTMDPSSRHDRGDRFDKSDGRRHRSRSTDSEEERQRRRRRKEREAVDSGRDRKYRDEGRDRRTDLTEKDDKDRRSHVRGKDDERDRKRRRSRSPAHESSRRHDDRDAKPRSKRDRSQDRGKRENSASQINRKNKGPLPSQAAAFQGDRDPTALVVADEQEIVEKQKPNSAPTGLLAAASNSISQVDGTSIVLKYHEPAEARKPPAKDVWNLYVFKGKDILETIELSSRSCWLVGRELAVVDMAAEHPSISKQHAVIQFRFIDKRNEFGDKLGKVRPYLIDLESANGTLLNKDEVPSSRYFELRDKDMIQFGHSTREYVLVLAPKDIPS